MHTQQQTILFSVVIPTRDRLMLLSDALRGLQAQTIGHHKFEVIVIDNGSSDGTIEALQDQVDDYDFTLIVKANPDCERGPAPARNLGVEIASGDIIAFLDSDCRPHQDWLLNASKIFAASANLSLATGIIDFKPEQRENLSFFSRKTVIALEEHPTYPTANSFYKRKVFTEHQGFNSELSFPNIFGQSVEAADTDLAWRVRNDEGEYSFMPDAIVYHEVQTLSVKEWLFEPLRLFLLPALVKRHPALRNKLLMGGIFFYPKSIFYYLLGILFIVLLFVSPIILLYIPILFILVALIKSRSANPSVIKLSLEHLLLNTIRNYAMCGALIYGSIKYRTFVL